MAGSICAPFRDLPPHEVNLERILAAQSPNSLLVKNDRSLRLRTQGILFVQLRFQGIKSRFVIAIEGLTHHEISSPNLLRICKSAYLV